LLFEVVLHLELESLVLALLQHFICFYLFFPFIFLFEVFNNFALLTNFFFYIPILKNAKKIFLLLFGFKRLLCFQMIYLKEKCENLYERYVLCLPHLIFGC
jgi:hypothetical protein